MFDTVKTILEVLAIIGNIAVIVLILKKRNDNDKDE